MQARSELLMEPFCGRKAQPPVQRDGGSVGVWACGLTCDSERVEVVPVDVVHLVLQGLELGLVVVVRVVEGRRRQCGDEVLELLRLAQKVPDEFPLVLCGMGKATA